MAFQAPSLKVRALRYLSQREHSRAELERKLQAHEETPGELAQVLDELEAKDFINPGRVAESVVHSKASRMGSLRLRQELQRKGLDGELIASALAHVKDSELERARELWRRKFGTPAQDAPTRAKHMRFLAARGFSGDVVRRAVQGGDED